MTASDLLQPKKRRNRARKPAWTFAGLDADHWRSDSQRVRWAQTDTMFKDVLTVLINERIKSHLVNQPGGHSESFHLGMVRGYEAAIAVVQSLAGGVVPPSQPLGEPDYPDQ
jgi:hypothetical protein